MKHLDKKCRVLVSVVTFSNEIWLSRKVLKNLKWLVIDLIVKSQLCGDSNSKNLKRLDLFHGCSLSTL